MSALHLPFRAHVLSEGGLFFDLNVESNYYDLNNPYLNVIAQCHCSMQGTPQEQNQPYLRVIAQCRCSNAEHAPGAVQHVAV